MKKQQNNLPCSAEDMLMLGTYQVTTEVIHSYNLLALAFMCVCVVGGGGGGAVNMQACEHAWAQTPILVVVFAIDPDVTCTADWAVKQSLEAMVCRWSLYTWYLLACQVSVTVGNSGLCRCIVHRQFPSVRVVF